MGTNLSGIGLIEHEKYCCCIAFETHETTSIYWNCSNGNHYYCYNAYLEYVHLILHQSQYKQHHITTRNSV